MYDEYRVYKKCESDESGACDNVIDNKDDISDEDLLLIRKYSRSEIDSADLYTFPVRLCDNDIDRDYERFSDDALDKIADEFAGITGIYDHNWKSGSQIARLYKCEVICEDGKTNSMGEAYKYVLGHAYMVRSDKNRDIIADIDAGIKKEVSVGCNIASRTCSICGKDEGECSHVKGRKYKNRGGNVLCHFILSGINDAYEWSFVAVPAQKKAGVMKKHHDIDKSDGKRDKNENCNMSETTLAARLDECQKKLSVYENELGELQSKYARKLAALTGINNKSAVDMLRALSDDDFALVIKSIDSSYARKFPTASLIKDDLTNKKNISNFDNNFKI